MQIYIFFMLILTGLGLINTSYLSYHTIKGTPVKCVFFPDEWCHKVQYSKYSRTFGIPNSFAGFSMYSLLLILLILFLLHLLAFWPIIVLVTFGFLFSLYFTAVQAFVLRAFCTWCVVSAIEFTLLFLIVMFLR